MSGYEYHTKIGSSTNIGTDCKILSNADVVHPGGVRGRIVSTSDSDSSTGTGIQKVILDYYITNWTHKTEVITLNGTTPVDTTETDIYRIESLEAFKVGSGNISAGTITLKSIDGASLFAQIDTGREMFERCLFYSELGAICTPISAALSSSSSGGVVFCVFATVDNTADGGSHVLKSYVSVEVKQSAVQINLNGTILMDMTEETSGLGICITARGLSAGQTGTATLICRDYHID